METSIAATRLQVLGLTLAVAASLSCGTAPSSPDATRVTPKPAFPNVAGGYTVTGTKPDSGESFNGTLIVSAQDEVFEFSRQSEGDTREGPAARVDNTVAAAYSTDSFAEPCGAFIYQIRPNGELDGKTAFYGRDKADYTRAVRTVGVDLEGSYEVSGISSDGKDLSSRLDVSREGEGYLFKWNSRKQTIGFGIKLGEMVVGASGGKHCIFAGYEIKPDGTLEGKWGSRDSRVLGTETAEKKN